MSHALRLRNLLWAGLCVLCWAGGLAHATNPVEEPDLKAAYIFNFIQFIEWPDSDLATDGDWPLCISPFSPLKRALTALEVFAANRARLAALARQRLYERLVRLYLDAYPELDGGRRPADRDYGDLIGLLEQ